MEVRSFVNHGLLAVALIVAQATVVSGVAEAAPKAKPVTEKRVPKAKAKKAAKAEEATAADAKAESAAAAPEAAPAAAEPQGTVQSAGTKATAKKEQKGAVKTEEDPEGVKSYEFSAIEVEGRLRSPQILYFLRRVRAEFDAGGLGHRSFLGELRDSRNHAAFR